MKLAGSTAVVSGASRGIGAATARALAHAGARVALLARSEGVDAVAAEIVAGGGQAVAYRVDLTVPSVVQVVAHEITAQLGTPDILVNNAGAGRFLAIEETSSEDAVAQMASPYFAAFHVTRAFIPALLARGSGRIVNLTSPPAFIPWAGATGYSTARWAMRGFTASLRADLYGTGIGVMLVLPGKVASTYFEHNPGSEDRIPRIAALIPTLTPEAVADAIVDGLRRDRREVVVPAALWLLLRLHALVPWPVEALMLRTGWQRGETRQGGR